MKPISIPSEAYTADKIIVNHSGGKDSQAMLAALVSAGLKDKLLIVHSDLGEMEWEPMHQWIEATSFGVPVVVVKPDLDFFELCRKYKRLPSGLARFCTSELKTNPINRWIKRYCAEQGFTHVVSCLGLRAEESPLRAKKQALIRGKASTKAVTITEWLPILDYKLADVWTAIEHVGQKPHQVYSKGFSRLSCVFCVFGKLEEHRMASELRPKLFDKVARLERELGKTIRLRQEKGVKLPKYLPEYIQPSVHKVAVF
jgi:3'-phosphoadenosine 5'-phosphosulfate sulfotransferase (PAPS reductase)/FAD synthetase